MLKDIETRLSYQGLKLEQYLKMMGKTEEDMKKEYNAPAVEIEALNIVDTTNAYDDGTPNFTKSGLDA